MCTELFYSKACLWQIVANMRAIFFYDTFYIKLLPQYSLHDTYRIIVQYTFNKRAQVLSIIPNTLFLNYLQNNSLKYKLM